MLEKLKAFQDQDAEVLAAALGNRYKEYQEAIRKMEQVILNYQEVAAVVRKRKSKIVKSEFFQTI
jgi:hypothetical protein